ncbi:hypothetical protein [Blastopirellula marina]|uniref:Uncharacterized protein n=1 Tax=Blastopirellula marina DSM 3645 TaxID=314230 RepID=A4A0E0_9BACT|nr:hypothetical protein [Blastopirellula marina]EAQ77760.1 hypothetical protein DSM3645_25362 [Blastopirellula marina DSM 3645]
MLEKTKKKGPHVPNDIRERLTSAKAKLRRKQKLDAMLGAAQVQLEQLQHDRSRMDRTLAQEKGDVDQLEGFSLTGLFHSILGVKAERLEKERQEYLAARLKYEECTQAVGDAQREVARLYEEYAGHGDTENDYNQLMEEKRRLLTQSGAPNAAAILNRTDQLADLEADRKELKEAISAGNTALRSLEQVRSELQAAENWGTWDMLGGGTMTTWAKHTRIDSAKREAETAQRDLRRFQKELADADQRLHVSLDEIGGFSTFADYFFDGLIADWIVQSKIQTAAAACDAAIQNVTSALNKCRHRHTQTEQDLKRLENERRQLIEEA